jgi:hypothetical protein
LNWDPTLKDDNLLKLKTVCLDDGVPIGAHQDPHSFDHFTFDFKALQGTQQGSRFGADSQAEGEVKRSSFVVMVVVP